VRVTGALFDSRSGGTESSRWLQVLDYTTTEVLAEPSELDSLLDSLFDPQGLGEIEILDAV
jgi:hypothetical protein